MLFNYAASKSDIYIVRPEWHYKKKARFCENLDKIDI